MVSTKIALLTELGGAKGRGCWEDEDVLVAPLQEPVFVVRWMATSERDSGRCPVAAAAHGAESWGWVEHFLTFDRAAAGPADTAALRARNSRGEGGLLDGRGSAGSLSQRGLSNFSL